MRHSKRVSKKWKFLLPIGRPMALLGAMFVGYALISGGQNTEAIGGLGILLVISGIFASWTGKIGSFWYDE